MGESYHDSSKGRVRVYQYNNNSWVQLGNDLVGQAFDEYVGSSVALSDDAVILSLGVPGYDSDKGTIRMYQYDNCSNSWVQLGNDTDMVGDENNRIANHGTRLSLSSDGTRVVAPSFYHNGKTGKVKVYYIYYTPIYMNDNNGQDIYLCAGSNQGNVGIGTTYADFKLKINGSIYATSGTITGSDDRLKHNEKPITNALDIIDKLEAKQYIKTTELYDASHHFELDASGNPLDASGNPLEKGKDYRIENGLIAQDLLKIPELSFVVSGGDRYKLDSSGNNTEIEQPYGVDYNSIHVLYVAALKELKETIKEDKTRISELESQLENVLSRLAELEGQ